jgi:hypothetical protein
MKTCTDKTCFCGRNKERAENARIASTRTDNYFGVAVILLLTFIGAALIFC